MTDESRPPPSARVIDPGDVDTLFVDWLLEATIHYGVVGLSVGSVEYASGKDRNGLYPVRVVAKIKMSRDFAHLLYAHLQSVLASTDEAEPKPPENLIN